MHVRLINTSILEMIDGNGFIPRNSSRKLSSASRASGGVSAVLSGAVVAEFRPVK